MAFTVLVVIQILLIIAGLFSMPQAEAPPKYGDCLMSDYLARVKQCETSFVKKLQENKNANCSVAFSGTIDCVVAVALKCFQTQITDPKVLNITEKQVKMQLNKLADNFCGKGTLTYPKQLQNMTDISKKCGSDFFPNANKCTKPFNDQFKDDWTSAKMCRLYAEGKQCVMKLFLKCKFYVNMTEALLNDYKKHYNPWCPSNRDPKEFFIGDNAAGTLSSYGTLLIAAAVGACVVLISP